MLVLKTDSVLSILGIHTVDSVSLETNSSFKTNMTPDHVEHGNFPELEEVTIDLNSEFLGTK